MKRRKKQRDKEDQLSIDHVDIPIFALCGLSLGFLFIGVLTGALGGVFDAEDGHMFSLTSILAGLASVGISLGIVLIGWVYWQTIFRKYGPVMPRLSIIGLPIALLSCASAVLLGAELTVYLTH